MSLEADVEAVRERISDTQALYREVCALMFFRYGETPTANKLYQLVRKGSMSAPAKALRDFWAQVRDKSRVDIGQPDLPPAVANAAGQLAAKLWEISTQEASSNLDVFRQDAQLEVLAAQEQAQDALKVQEVLAARLADAESLATTLRTKASELEARIVELQTANDMLRADLVRSRDETGRASAELGEARRDFAKELDRLRESHDLNETRLAAAERRALLEIERERALTADFKRAVAAAEVRLNEVEESTRVEAGQFRQQLEASNVRAALAEAHAARLEAELEAKTTALAEQTSVLTEQSTNLQKMATDIVSRVRGKQLPRPRIALPHSLPVGSTGSYRSNRKPLRLSLQKRARGGSQV